jgi:hypothetical protein
MSERPPRRMGRPPLDPRHPSIQVTLRMPAPDYDALCRRAARDRVNVTELMRQRLHARDADDDP